jgi:tetratricopeptide (TPR) repeat protein
VVIKFRFLRHYDQVLKLRPEGYEHHAASVLDLGLALQQFCAEQSFAAERLDLAIALLRDAVKLSHSEGPAHRHAISCLSVALLSKFQLSGGSDVLVKRIDVCRVVLSLYPVDHPDYLVAVGNLAGALLLCFEKEGGEAWLREAVSWFRQALDLCPLGHPEHFDVLNYLACVLRA